MALNLIFYVLRSQTAFLPLNSVKTVIHGGLHKTGSTALQVIFSNAFSSLPLANILYPSLKPWTSELSCHHSIAIDCCNHETRQFLKAYEHGPSLEEVKRQVFLSSPDLLLLSSESFSSHNIDSNRLRDSELLSFLYDVSDEIHFIVFLRSPVQIAHSAYTEGVTNMFNYLTFEQQIEHALGEDHVKQEFIREYTWNLRLKPWIELDRVKISAIGLKTNPSLIDLNVAERLLLVAGMNIAAIKRLGLEDCGLINQNPGLMTIAALRYSIPHVCRKLNYSTDIPIVKDFVYRKAFESGWIKTPYRGITTATCKEFARLFDASNALFWNEYGKLGSPRDVLSRDLLLGGDQRELASNDIDLECLSDNLKNEFDSFLMDLDSLIDDIHSN